MSGMREHDKESEAHSNLLSENPDVQKNEQEVRLSVPGAGPVESAGSSGNPQRFNLIKIISGGQVGADIAALRAAKSLGVETGGYMPHGYKTAQGNKPEYAELYGMFTTVSEDYPPRTSHNVRKSDGTLRIAYNFDSYGERATLREIYKWSKPHYDVNPRNFSQDEIRNVVDWLLDHDIRILNVAGNAKPEIEPFVEMFIVSLIREGRRH